MSYRTYKSVRYGYGCRTELTSIDVVPSLLKGSGMVRLLVPVPVPDLRCFNREVPGTRVFSSGSTELTKVSGTGMDVVPNSPKCRVRVWSSYQAYQSVGYGQYKEGVCTSCTLWYVPYQTQICSVCHFVC